MYATFDNLLVRHFVKFDYLLMGAFCNVPSSISETFCKV